MPISIDLEDTEFPKQPIIEARRIARAVLINDKGEVCVHRVHRDDAFGNQVYLETPGGGVDEGETYEEAVVRECEEEAGCAVEIIAYLGEVRDFYNKIGRKNINRYFLCKVIETKQRHYESSGDYLIEQTRFLPLEEVIRGYHAMDSHLVSGLVKRRELPIFEQAKNQIR